jgi:hypothetical protein
MTLTEGLTLAGLVVGPIAAVLISLEIDRRRRDRERKLTIMRMLLTTRRTPADAAWINAINLIPAEFNDEQNVMDAWRRYHSLVRETPSEQQKADHEQRVNVAQSALIHHVMKSVGLKLSEGDIQTEVYLSQAYVDRDLMYLKSLQAMPEIAAAMKEQVANTKAMMAAAKPNQTAPK